MIPCFPPPLQTEPEENPVSQEGVPPGYEAISLVEALNGQVVPQNGQTDGEIPCILLVCRGVWEGVGVGWGGEVRDEAISLVGTEWSDGATEWTD